MTMRITFNPLAFSVEENNEFIRLGWEPLPPSMWRLTEERKAQIEAERRLKHDRRTCPCVCHDTGGSGHDHEGRHCAQADIDLT